MLSIIAMLTLPKLLQLAGWMSQSMARLMGVVLLVMVMGLSMIQPLASRVLMIWFPAGRLSKTPDVCQVPLLSWYW